jgi:hypothetical protein
VDRAEAAFIDFEFETGTTSGVMLKDIASSLVTIDELLRDLASITAEPLSGEYRNVEIAAIEMRSPLTIRLSLTAISPAALTAFQGICRDIIVGRDGGDLHLSEAASSHLSERETERLHGHVAMLRNAATRLRRIAIDPGA